MARIIGITPILAERGIGKPYEVLQRWATVTQKGLAYQMTGRRVPLGLRWQVFRTGLEMRKERLR